MAAQGGATQVTLDQVPELHVSCVEPDFTPYVHDTRHVPPFAVAEQEPEPYCGGEVSAAQPAPWQMSVDHTALVHVRVVLPLATPLVHVMLVQVPPSLVAGHVPEPYCGVPIAAQGAPWQTGRADHDPALQVSVVDPEITP